jgi:7-cyano-7-deazaguanine synthase
MNYPTYAEVDTEANPDVAARPTSEPHSIVPIVSGGLDSITMLYDLMEQGHSFQRIVSFNYGQRHKKELHFASIHADRFGLQHTIIDLSQSGLVEVLNGSTSSLTNPDIDVPEGSYDEENMRATVVPNRNMMMLAIAGAIAVSDNANCIATAVHAGDHAIYPDCRPSFFYDFTMALKRGNEGFGNLAPTPVLTPFIHKTKGQIAKTAIELDLPLETTWSCYKGGNMHCGRCGTCVERLEAVAWAESVLGKRGYDDTPYADREFWKSAVKWNG